MLQPFTPPILSHCNSLHYTLLQRFSFVILLTLGYAFAPTARASDYKGWPATSDTSTNNVVVLGNSITKHPIDSLIPWLGEWGMAASRREYDFCHRLDSMLGDSYEVIGHNIADWERTFDPTTLNTPLASITNRTRYVIIRLGENVIYPYMFEESLLDLVDLVRNTSQSATLLISGMFWTDSLREDILARVAEQSHAGFIRLDQLDTDDNKPHIGDIVYDENGHPYTIEQAGVARHPSDAGMYHIAAAVYDAIRPTLAIKPADVADATIVARYDIHGRKLSAPARGINILQMSDGTTRKVYVR